MLLLWIWYFHDQFWTQGLVAVWEPLNHIDSAAVFKQESLNSRCHCTATSVAMGTCHSQIQWWDSHGVLGIFRQLVIILLHLLPWPRPCKGCHSNRSVHWESVFRKLLHKSPVSYLICPLISSQEIFTCYHCFAAQCIIISMQSHVRLLIPIVRFDMCYMT